MKERLFWNRAFLKQDTFYSCEYIKKQVKLALHLRTIVVNKVEINRYSLSGVLIEYRSYFDSGDYTLAALSFDSFFTAQTLFAIKAGFSKETKIVKEKNCLAQEQYKYILYSKFRF